MPVHLLDVAQSRVGRLSCGRLLLLESLQLEQTALGLAKAPAFHQNDAQVVLRLQVRRLRR